MFFRQGSLGRSIGGASHTRHLCGNKRGAGEGRRRSPSPRRACAIFIARTTPACYNNPPTPDLLSQSSGPRQSGAEASQPRLAPIRAQTAGFFLFYFFSLFFFSPFFARRRIKICLRRINTNRPTERATRPPRPVVSLIKNFSNRPLILIIATDRCACR